MNFQTLIDLLIDDTLVTSLPNFKPELILCATIVVMLLVRIVRLGQLLPSFVLAVAGSVLALWLALPQEGLASWAELTPRETFTGMLVQDAFSAYIRVFLLAFAVLFIVLSRMTGLAERDNSQDFYTLVLGAILGMCIMASANHLLTLFLSVEMASVPSYVLTGIVRGKRRSSEAALKYAVYGAGAAGVMLYGISLLAGVLGTAHLPTMARELAALDISAMLASGEQSMIVMVLALGGLMLGVGLAFKLSAVPFHFWCPDVFEGASAEVGAFLSVASKGAALALLVRVGLGLGYLEPEPQTALVVAPASLNASVETSITLVDHHESEDAAAEATDPLSPVRTFFVTLVAVIAAITCTFGNLAAYGQTNIKRMLAYSTIAHAGFMMMAVAASVALAGSNIEQSQMANSALLFYIAIYLFMNLGAFAIIAFLRNAMNSEEIQDYAGLIRSCPMTAVMMTAILVSLIGLPPLAGFWPKLRVLQALYVAGGPLLITVLVIAAVNTAISLIYYLRVAKVMCIDPEPNTRGTVSLGFLPGAYILAVSLPVLIFGIFPDQIARWANEAVRFLY